ncbi:hypothetical protein BDP27DRAFT_1372203 [Rhodocollybia butyracea]|uniref:Uncharacterized protein n=1 Tax=Rhodocollybia butyracea TaxID=206335 RepID=A0A9P5PAX7_9AGAR|nr:hypothetical protein BDP27DRAFT_1372203 [Rhodocollybia butyracea]
MSSSPSDVEILAEVLTQDILPKASRPILWILVFITVFMAILQRVLLSCVTLSSLRETVDAVDKLLKGHETGIHTMHTSITVSVDASIIKRAGFESTRSLIKFMNVIKIHLGLYTSPLLHSIALSSKQHNEWKLDSATQLRRRNISNPQCSAGI